MGRRRTKLSLELIPDEKARKVTFRKRKNGLLKKAFELKTLCDVKVCTIIYEKKSKGELGPPLTYPAESEEVKQIIDKYRSYSSKKKVQTVQVQKEIRKLRSKGYKDKYPTWDDRFNRYTVSQLHGLLDSLESKLEAAHKVRSLMVESKKSVVQETIPPMQLFPSTQYDSQIMHASFDEKFSDYASMMMMMMNDSDNYWDQSATASASWAANSNIQYDQSNASNYTGTISIWDYDINVPAQYGNMDEKPAFYNPMQPCMYDSILSTSQQQAAAPSIEHPINVGLLDVAYDLPLSQTMQPSYVECPVSTGCSSFEYKQLFAASSESKSQSYADDQAHMLYNMLPHGYPPQAQNPPSPLPQSRPPPPESPTPPNPQDTWKSSYI